MAAFNKPVPASNYDDFCADIRAVFADLARGLSSTLTTPSNLPVGAFRWDPTAKTFQNLDADLTTWNSVAAFAFPIVGGSVNNSPVGNATPASGAFTTLSASGAATGVTRPANDNSTNFATTAFFCGQFSGAAPLAHGTASAGTGYLVSRHNHVHPMPSFSQLGGVIISSPASGHIVRHNGSNFVNASLSAAGIQATITGAASSVVTSDLTASMVAVTSAGGKLAAHTHVTVTELMNLNASTGNIQAQIDAVVADVAAMPAVYTGSNKNNLVFPIGATLAVKVGGIVPDRNADVNVFTLSGNDAEFQTGSGASELTGQWSARGVVDIGGTEYVHVERRS